MEKEIVICPKCGSRKTYKDGIRYTRGGEIQRYLCCFCAYMFSSK